MDEKKIVSFLRFVFGMAFIISGLTMVTYSIPSMIFYVIFGLMLLPKFHTENPLDDLKAKMPKWERIAITVGSFALGVVFYWLSGAAQL